MPKQKINDPGAHHASSGALIRRFLPYLVKYKKTLFLDLFCAALTTLCDIVLPKIMSTITNSAMGVGITLTAGIVLRLAAVYFVLRIIDGAASYYMSSIGHIMGVHIETDMRRDAFDHLLRLDHTYYNNTKVGTIMGRITRLFDGLMYLVVILAGGLSLVYGRITAGDLVAYMLYVTTLIATIRRIVEFAEQFQRGMTGIERFAEIMDTPVAIQDAPDAVPLQPGPGAIRFENVSFEYPDDHNKVLHDISLDIHAGERLALVGASGGGKTTLCNLIPRFYEVTDGRILIDGQDIRHVTLKSLRQDIGIVQQDVYLFSGTVAQNIAYGKPGATREEIVEAARLAGAERFILALKDGFDTYVGERGVKLSGGQKQRIAIARVFLKNPPILILDEATSALDNESEILVGQSLEKLAHGRTTLTIAHRLTTIKDYDRILVLGEEGIVESGTHEQLLAKQGVYYRLWNQLPGEDTL